MSERDFDQQLLAIIDGDPRADVDALSNPAARSRYIDLVATQILLIEHLESAAPATAAETASPQRKAVTPATSLRMPIAFAFAAAVLLTAAAVAVYLTAFAGGESSDGPQELAEAPTIATLIDATGTVTAGRDIAYPGADYKAGDFAIEDGSAELQLTNGANIQLIGRTRIGLSDPLLAHLDHGSARFNCPPGAVGFTVALPDGSRVVDLGTRFAVRIDADKRIRVHVLEGAVRVERPGLDSPIELHADDVVRFGSGADDLVAYRTDDAFTEDAEASIVFHDDFDAPAFDYDRWNTIDLSPPHTRVVHVDDTDDLFARGIANRILGIIDTDTGSDPGVKRPCLLAHLGGLEGHDTASVSFDFFIPNDAALTDALLVRLFSGTLPYSGGKLYSVRLAAAGVSDDAAPDTLAPLPIGRPVRINIVTNHSNTNLRYEAVDGVHELPAYTTQVWIGRRLALERVIQIEPDAHQRSMTGFAFLSASADTSRCFIDNVTVRVGPRVDLADPPDTKSTNETTSDNPRVRSPRED